MVSFQELEFHKKQSVYLQLILFVKRQILAGKIENYAEMPSRRELAVQLSINPNTVQKAYKLMEEEGLIKTISNVKSVVNVNDEVVQSIQAELLEEQIHRFAQECKQSGLSFQKTIELLTKHWDQ